MRSLANPPTASISVDDGSPISDTVVEQASKWLVKSWSGLATLEETKARDRWRAAHADHERAWQRLIALERKFELVPRNIAKEVLQPGARARGRRRTLKTLGVLFTGGAAVYITRQTPVWQRYTADYQTSIGETRNVTLQDGTQVVLNTASAIDVRFTEKQRRISLRSGEILIQTARDSFPGERPFVVATPHGTVRALGTRFTVRSTGSSQVAVFAGAVLVEPADGTTAVRLNAGEQTAFSTRSVQPPFPADERASAWASGSLVVERMRLDVFLQELSRYRPGWLRCDPAVGHLLLTGVYSLPDTDRILASIEKALPVRAIRRSRYWVTVTAR